MNQNHGLNWEKEKADETPKDWVFSAVSPVCIAEGIVPYQRDLCLPKGEIQQGVEDMMDCATRSALNVLETKFNWLVKNKKIEGRRIKFLWQYMNENGKVEFSDAFIAILSGTTKNGNSLKAPIEAIRKNGLIPKKLLPLEKTMIWDDFHNPKRITEEMEKIGKEFLKHFSINYEKVYEKDMDALLDRDMLDVAGYAWPTPKNGEYPRVEYTPNHAFMAIRKPMTYIFDNYIDYVDGDFIKKLTSDYDFLDHAYRIIISELPQQQEKGWWQKFINWIRKWLS